MEVPCIIPVASAADDPDYAPEFIAVPLPEARSVIACPRPRWYFPPQHLPQHGL